MKKLNSYSSNQSQGSQGRLIFLFFCCLAVATVGIVATIWLGHLTDLSYKQIARLETENQEYLRRAATLNNGIAHAQSPENMQRELERIHSDLRLPSSSQVIRISATELMAANQRYRETDTTGQANNFVLWDRPINP